MLIVLIVMGNNSITIDLFAWNLHPSPPYWLYILKGGIPGANL